MKPNYHIEPGLVDNQSQFDHAFFQQFKLRHADSPLMLRDDINKDYLFPTLYGNVSCAIGVFLCDYDKAQAMLPHTKMKPVAMPKGRALVTFSCYQYKQVLGLPGYNEIAMTIPVMVDPLVNIPVLPMLLQGFKKFGYYVFHMPVTSEENRIRGNQIWGLPKFVETIDIQETRQFSTTQACDEAGNNYFSLTVPTTGKATAFDVTSNLYSRLNDALLQSETRFKGTFNLNKYSNRLWKTGGEDPGMLIIGEGPNGDMLRSLDISPQPFQFRYTANMNACFDLPNEQFKPPFDFTTQPLEAIS